MSGDIAAVVQQIAADTAVLGLGDLVVLRALPSGLVLEGHSVLYIVDLQLGPADDRQVIRLVERWAAVRRQHANRRCFAVLVAEQFPPRYVNILPLIGRAVPLLALEVDIPESAGDAALRFTPVGLRLR